MGELPSQTHLTTYLWGVRSNVEEILIDFLFDYLNRTRGYGYGKFMSWCFVSVNYSVSISYRIIKMSIKHANVQINNPYHNQQNQMLWATSTRKHCSSRLGAFSII
jgi:hypothetical protein